MLNNLATAYLQTGTYMSDGRAGAGKKILGIILYSSPTTSQFWFGLEIARHALAQGYAVHAFAWGDAEFALIKSDGTGDYSRASRELSSLLDSEDFILDACTTCFKVRGLPSEQLIPGAHLSGLHKIPEIVKTCYKTLAMIP